MDDDDEEFQFTDETQQIFFKVFSCFKEIKPRLALAMMTKLLLTMVEMVVLNKRMTLLTISKYFLDESKKYKENE